MSRWLAFLPLAAILALALLFGLYSLKRDPQVKPDALVGKPIPELTLARLDDGRPAALRATLGEPGREGPVLVNIFASWCAPCEIEHPVLVDLKRQGVRIVGVAYKDAPENTKARPFMAVILKRSSMRPHPCQEIGMIDLGQKRERRSVADRSPQS